MKIERYNRENIDRQAQALYQQCAFSSAVSFLDKIKILCSQFLGKPYLLGACGEGLSATWDQCPLYRFDSFDCLTYVNTVLAMAMADTYEKISYYIGQINYYAGQVDYCQRYHFMSIDWNPNNVKLGIIADITASLTNEQGNVLSKIAIATIDKPNWFCYRSLADIKLLELPDLQKQQALLDRLHLCAKYWQKQESHLPYVPLAHFFGQTAAALYAQIPDVAIIEIVRPNWQLRDKIGTNIQVSHVGFGVREKNDLYFYHASLIHQKVEKVLLQDYLRYCQSIPTIHGINIQKINA